MDSYCWSLLDLKEKGKLNLGKYALLILNRPILVAPEEMIKLWNEASIRSTVDGGTTRWFDYLKENDIKVNNEFPDIVSGDFDSISPELLKTCKENGVYVERTPDQNYTDFTKAIQVIQKRSEIKLDTLLVIVDDSGRIDHTFSNLNTLYEVPKIFAEQKIATFLITSVSLTWMLRPGTHTIHIPNYIKKNKHWCAILPFLPVKNKVTTTGLKWNLDNQTIEFGGLISSSNTYDDHTTEVTIKTDAEIIWSMGLAKED